MKLLIKILGQSRQFPALKVDFGPGYTFPWNEKVKAYTYAPKTQKEIDDIFLSQTVHSVWFFAPHILPDEPAPAADASKAAEPAAPTPPEKPTPEAEAEIARLQGLLRAAEGVIAKKSTQAKADAETIELLRADLKAQQDKAAAAAAAATPKKPVRAAKPPPATPPDTAPDLAPD